ncbi:MAG: hypothetical protein EOO62_02190 [Hymenobacter sp.]|nr:MAG: hypothetical protein EOO62_02190 [Hymenobacter sp.]
MPPHTLVQYVKNGLLLLTIIGAAAIAAARYRHLPPNLRPLAWLTWFELPLEVAATTIGWLHHNNLFIMPFYTVGELWLLSMVYGRTVQASPFARALPWLVAAFATYVLIDNVVAPDLTWFKPGQQVIQSLLILGMVGMYFRELLNELRVARLERDPLFWVSVGLALYFLGYILIALFSNYMLQHYSLQFNKNVWSIHFVLSLLLHSSYAGALWLQPANASATAWPGSQRRPATPLAPGRQP